MTLARYRARKYWGWMRALAPEDWQQCVAIGEHANLTEMGRQMRALAASLGMRRRYGTMRHEQSRTADIVRKPDTRPSRAKRRTGYRKDSAAHREARLKVTAERRAEIAREGARARWNVENSSAA